MEKTLQETPHEIKKRILYKNPASELYRRHVDPADGLILTFPHLPDEDILLLQRKGVIAPLSDKEVKEREAIAQETQRAIELATKQAEAEEAAREKETAKQKAAAAKKMKAAEKEQAEESEVNDGENS